MDPMYPFFLREFPAGALHTLLRQPRPTLRSGVHTRPDGRGKVCLLLWAYDLEAVAPEYPVPLHDHGGGVYPEVCLRGLSHVVPGFRHYLGHGWPQPYVDGGYYCKV